MPRKTSWGIVDGRFMQKLTPSNYFSPQNTRISNSKISDYLKSKEYFYAKHIEHSLIEEPTDAMIIGKIVDTALTHGNIDSILERWEMKVLKKDDPEKYEFQKNMDQTKLVSETVMTKAVEMAQTVLCSRFYKQDLLRKTYRQIPLEATFNGVEICGLPDQVALSDEDVLRIDITDWKTSAPSDVTTPERWIAKIRDYGYDRQFVMYQILVINNLKKFGVKKKKKNIEWTFRHAVIESVKDGKYGVHLFKIDESLLAEAYFKLRGTIADIAADIKGGKSAFIDKTLAWEDAITLKI